MAKPRRPRLRAVVAVGALVVLGLAVVFTALLLRDGRPATAQQRVGVPGVVGLDVGLGDLQKPSAQFLVLSGERSGSQLRLLGPVEQAGGMARGLHYSGMAWIPQGGSPWTCSSGTRAGRSAASAEGTAAGTDSCTARRSSCAAAPSTSCGG